MAFTPAFTVAQGLDVTSFTLTDGSSGDPNITGRTISLFEADGGLLGGAVIDWPMSDGSAKALTGILTPWDFALNILVTWTSSSPVPGSDYTKVELVTFTGQSNAFAYSLVQQISSTQAITRNTNYLYNLALVNSDILNADRASDFGDIGAAQECLNRIYNFYVNRSMFF